MSHHHKKHHGWKLFNIGAFIGPACGVIGTVLCATGVGAIIGAPLLAATPAITKATKGWTVGKGANGVKGVVAGSPTPAQLGITTPAPVPVYAPPRSSSAAPVYGAAGAGAGRSVGYVGSRSGGHAAGGSFTIAGHKVPMLAVGGGVVAVAVVLYSIS